MTRSRGDAAASASPRVRGDAAAIAPLSDEQAPRPEPSPRRAARIVSVPKETGGDAAKQRLRLLGRLLACQGRGAISRLAEECRQAGVEFPEEQDVQLQLLEHFDESRARDALAVLGRLFADEPPIKRPVLEQRLRRLEETADEGQTREAAAALRRSLRS